jgi:ABC-type multidrug transport system ATPase subunit
MRTFQSYNAYGLILQMIGLVKPTCGTAYIHGMDLRREMDQIYASIGVCPQHEYVVHNVKHAIFYIFPRQR